MPGKRDQSLDFDAYCEYKGYVPQPGDSIARESIHTLTPQRLWDKYISKRRPVVIRGFPDDPDWKAHKWTNLNHLNKQAGHVPVKVEPLHPGLGHFGTAATRHTTDFGDFLEKLRDPKHKGQWYLTTQYDSEDDEEDEEDDSDDSQDSLNPSNKRKRGDDSSSSDEDHEDSHDDSDISLPIDSDDSIPIDDSASSTLSSAQYDSASSSSDDSIVLNTPDPVLSTLPASFRPSSLDPLLPSPTHALVHEFPPQPEIMGNLVLQQTNLWVGNCADGKSSGLHHDFHDNLYALLAGRKRFLLFCPPAFDYLHPRGNVERVHENGLIEYTPRDTLHVDHPLSNRLPIRPDGLPPSEAARWRLMARRKAVEDAYEDAASTSGEGHIPTHRRKGKARMTPEQEAALRAYEQSIEDVVRLAQLEDDDDDDDEWSLPRSQDSDEAGSDSASDSDVDQEAVFYDGEGVDASSDEDDDSSSNESSSASSASSLESADVDDHVRELVERARAGDERAVAVLDQLMQESSDEEDDSEDEEITSSEDDDEDSDADSSSSDESASSDAVAAAALESSLPREIRALIKKARNGDEDAAAVLDDLLESSDSNSDDDDDDIDIADERDDDIEDEEITSESSDSDSDSDLSSSSDEGSTLDIPRRKGQSLPGGLRREDREGDSDNEFDDMPGAELLFYDGADGEFGFADSDDDDDSGEERLAAMAPGARRGLSDALEGSDLSDLLQEAAEQDVGESDESEESDSDDSESEEDSADIDDSEDFSEGEEEELKAAILAHLDNGGQIVVDDSDDDEEEDDDSEDVSDDSNTPEDSVVIEGSDESLDSSEEAELKAAILAHLDAGGQIVVDDEEDEEEDEEDSISGSDSDSDSEDTDIEEFGPDGAIYNTNNLTKKEEKQLKRALLRHLESGKPIIDEDDSSIDSAEEAELAAAQDSDEEEAILTRMLLERTKRHGGDEDDSEEDDDDEDASADSSMNTDEAEEILEEMVDAGHFKNSESDDDEEDSDSGSDSTESDLFPREDAEDDEDDSEESNWEADEDDFAEGEKYLAALAAADGNSSERLAKFAPSSDRSIDEDKEPLSFSKIDPSVLHAHFGLSDSIDGKFKKSKKHSKKGSLKPRKRCPEPLVVDLQPGEMLYLPASWWHEVTSEAHDARGDDVHMALNWWFHPPDNLTSSKKQKKRQAGSGSSSSNGAPLQNGLAEPYRDTEVWSMIRAKVQRTLEAAREEQRSYAEAMKEFEAEIEREVRDAARRKRRGGVSSSSEDEEVSRTRRSKKVRRA